MMNSSNTESHVDLLHLYLCMERNELLHVVKRVNNETFDIANCIKTLA